MSGILNGGDACEAFFVEFETLSAIDDMRRPNGPHMLVHDGHI